MRCSAHGVEFIAAYEGFVNHPYRDSGGVWTIGYGHTGPGVAVDGHDQPRARPRAPRRSTSAAPSTR